MAKHAPEGVAVYDDEGKDGFHDQFLYAKGTGPKVDENGVAFVDLAAGIYKGISKTEIGDMSLTTFGTVEADLSGIPFIEASGVASAYTRKKGKFYDTMLFTEFLFEDIKTGKQRIVEQFT